MNVAASEEGIAIMPTYFGYKIVNPGDFARRKNAGSSRAKADIQGVEDRDQRAPVWTAEGLRDSMRPAEAGGPLEGANPKLVAVANLVPGPTLFRFARLVQVARILTIAATILCWVGIGYFWANRSEAEMKLTSLPSREQFAKDLREAVSQIPSGCPAPAPGLIPIRNEDGKTFSWRKKEDVVAEIRQSRRETQ